MSETPSRTIPVAVLLLAGTCAMAVVLYTFTDARAFRGRYELRAAFDDVHGIRKGDPVRMRGVNVGRVVSFVMRDDAVELVLEMEREYGVPSDSEVRLVSAGLIGGMMANVVPGKSRQMARDGDRLRASAEPFEGCALEKLAATAVAIPAKAELAGEQGRTPGANR